MDSNSLLGIQGHMTDITSSTGCFLMGLSADAKGFKGVEPEPPSHAQ